MFSQTMIYAILVGLVGGGIAAAVFRVLKRDEASSPDFRERWIRTFFTAAMLVASLAYIAQLQMAGQ